MALLNAHQTFSSSNLFSGVVQLTHSDNTLVGTFGGNGSGLKRLLMSHPPLEERIAALRNARPDEHAVRQGVVA